MYTDCPFTHVLVLVVVTGVFILVPLAFCICSQTFYLVLGLLPDPSHNGLPLVFGSIYHG